MSDCKEFDRMVARLGEAVERMTAEEIDAIYAALQTAEKLGGLQKDAIMLAIARIGCSYARTRKHAEQCRASDNEKRVLVGARLPRETADKYKRLADYLGISMYAWVSDALDREYRRQSPETK